MRVVLGRCLLNSSLHIAVSGCMLGIAASVAPANALTPLKSPEQMSRDEALIARASLAITQQMMRCFNAPDAGGRRAFAVQFFLGQAGRNPSRFKIIGIGPGSYPARSAREKSAIRAIRTCAPYAIPAELRSWGGFWATIDFR